MRKLTYLVATTLDGFIAAPDGGFGDFLFEGDHMAALIEQQPDTVPTQMREPLGITGPNKSFDTVLMGRSTYQVPGGLPSPYAHLRQYVVSSTLSDTPADVEVVSGDVLAKVRELKAEDGLDIWLCGGGKLAAALLPEIDRLVLKVHPVVLGRGIPLFDGEFPAARFALVETQAFSTGVVFSTFTKS
ncbi:dihydrofolate reductase family protein [Actinosynnema sp. NPDC047251]|uniref:Dihydrofolate reductase n=1 Tax=Saccharothrix espanaensis (strain ATCC 51144 / DSM 44229 / JCM 9112 / NBRC 15066 / NRRL 15764) TaxID=1179773 RepID=K0KBW1_SACES|nr:dihydrofolate reductase family protein [Saccharothrix espanaensis]CCH35032.1 Dihydrofolate reductase [Saccharothrix espanaensis DSM 44229]